MTRPPKRWPLFFAFLSWSAFLALVVSGRLEAAEESAVQVAQPIWTENGIVVSPVTYILWLGSPAPGIEVAWTAKTNLIEREGDSTPSNRNAAALYGVDIRIKPNPKWKDWPRDFADTLQVVLELSGLAERDSSKYLPEEWVVKATVECILVNAGRSRPPVKFVDLEVEGRPEYNSFAKVHSVDRTSRGPGR